MMHLALGMRVLMVDSSFFRPTVSLLFGRKPLIEYELPCQV
jgi:hypothetical protein